METFQTGSPVYVEVVSSSEKGEFDTLLLLGRIIASENAFIGVEVDLSGYRTCHVFRLREKAEDDFPGIFPW